MSLHKIILPTILLLLTFLGCQRKKEQQNEKQRSRHSQNREKDFEQKVIYGVDDRLEYYQVGSRRWRKMGDSVVALIYNRNIESPKVPWDANQLLELSLSNYGLSFGLCPHEAFGDQSIVAHCTGSLIGPDLILTAGHCVEDQDHCQSSSFVFDFSYKSPQSTPTSVRAGNVYSCKKLIHSEVLPGRSSDFAIVQLDRIVADRQPLAIRRTGDCLLYTSPSPRDATLSRMPSSA